MIRIQSATGQTDLDDIRRLFREYEAFLDVDLCFQGFEEELAGLPGRYAPPLGALVIARAADQPAGCVALRAIGFPVCEMKRLYVRPEFRKAGLGRRLCAHVIFLAKRLGYKAMRLDTLEKLTQAVVLYKQLGFIEILPYYPNPLPGVLYWELNLALPEAAPLKKPPSQYGPSW